MGKPRFIYSIFSIWAALSAGHNAWADASGSSGMAMGQQMVNSTMSMAFAATMISPCHAPGGTASCVAMAAGFLGGAMGMAMAFMDGDKAGELSGGDYGGMGDYSFDDPNFTPNNFLNDPSCANGGGDPLLCKPGAYKDLKDQIVGDLKNKIKSGQITGADADKINSMLDAANSKDVNAMLAALGANPDAANAMNDYMNKNGGAASNGNVAYSGEADASADAAAGAGGADKGGKGNSFIDSALGSVDWNGLLDMLDSKTGKSLTLWQRATRRYQGGPGSKRALMLARMEVIRKTALAKLKSQKGTSVATREVKAAPPANRRPAMAPKH